MVNNYTNINKINNHFSPKGSLNSDGQQLHQYQQNIQQPFTSNNSTTKNNNKYQWKFRSCIGTGIKLYEGINRYDFKIAPFILIHYQ